MTQIKNEYHVGELAEYFGVSKDTLRLYDKLGILSPKKNEENGYRVYNRADFICLDYVMRLRSLGMTLEDIKMMINDCTIEHAEAVMQIQDRILGEKIEELKTMQMMAKDYQKSFSKAIQNLGNISIEMSERLIYMDADDSIKDAMAEFSKLTYVHVPKFTFVVEKENFFDEDVWKNIISPEVRKNFMNYAITLVDDGHFGESPDFVNGKFRIIPPQKCVHATLRVYTNRDYSEFIRCKDYIRDNGLRLTGNPMYRILSARNNSQKSVDYYEFWAPVE